MKFDLEDIDWTSKFPIDLHDMMYLVDELRAARAVIKAAVWPMDHKLLTAALEHYEEVTK